MYVHVCTCMYVHVCTCMYVYMYVHVCMYVCMYVCMNQRYESEGKRNSNLWSHVYLGRNTKYHLHKLHCIYSVKLKRHHNIESDTSKV